MSHRRFRTEQFLGRGVVGDDENAAICRKTQHTR
jgi:hypothetical protein